MAVNKLDISMMEDVGTSANQLVQRDGSGNLPAVDGSLVTGLKDYTTSASDPVITTNPSDGVGTVWYNQTSGEMYICTDATAGANVWTNVGAGTGDVEPSPSYQGETYGYMVGGYTNVGSPLFLNNIQKFSFTSGTANASDVANLIAPTSTSAGHSSTTHGYSSGGYITTSGPAGGGGGWAQYNVVEKFQFSNDADSVDSQDLYQGRFDLQSTQTETHGYCHGGSYAGSGNDKVDTIDKFPFASSSNGTDVGNLTLARYQAGGCSSATHGYALGGHGNIGGTDERNIIDRYSFATDGNATDVGDLARLNSSAVSTSSSVTHGYLSCGWTFTPSNSYLQEIQKFAYASSSNAANIGTATQAKTKVAGCSSTTYGYSMGGNTGWPTVLNVIERYSFSTDGNASDVGDLAVNSNYAAGNVQV